MAWRCGGVVQRERLEKFPWEIFSLRGCRFESGRPASWPFLGFTFHLSSSVVNSSPSSFWLCTYYVNANLLKQNTSKHHSNKPSRSGNCLIKLRRRLKE